MSWSFIQKGCNLSLKMVERLKSHLSLLHKAILKTLKFMPGTKKKLSKINGISKKMLLLATWLYMRNGKEYLQLIILLVMKLNQLIPLMFFVIMTAWTFMIVAITFAITITVFMVMFIKNVACINLVFSFAFF